MIIVDIETTGIDPKKHSIVSMGAIDFDNPKRQFYVENRAWDGAEVYEGNKALEHKPALLVNGFTVQEIRSIKKPTLKEAITLFIEWALDSDDPTIAGYNVHFDLGFLIESARKYNLVWQFNHSGIDLHTLVYIHKSKKKDIKNFKSKHCYKYLGLPPEKIPHNALYGARLKAESFSRILYAKNLLKQFERYKIPKYLEEI